MNCRKQVIIASLSFLTFISIEWLPVWKDASATENYAAGQSYSATVLKIVDGDTVDVAINGKTERVRLACINTPERREKPFYKKAKDYLAQLIPVGSTVKVLISPQVRDNTSSKRLVAEIFAPRVKQPVNQTMVAQGQAVVYCQYISNCNKKSYLASERSAKQAKLGIWNPQLPWDRANKYTCK